MSRFWSPLVHQLTPYVPGEQPKIADLTKLNTNENPYPPSPKVLAALQAAANEGLRLYPDPQSQSLRNTLAQTYGLSSDEVFVGNGSDEVLAIIFQALLKQTQPILFPDITYSFYPVYCQLYGIDYETQPLDAAFQIELQDYQRPCGGIIFPNPNAPTGLALPLDRLTNLLKQQPDRVVVVDEAYVDFGTESAVRLIKDHPNLLVCQTFSKAWSLAGLRVGFALGHPDLIEALHRVKDSFNSYPLDRLAQAGAEAALKDKDYTQACCAKIIQSREHLTEALQQRGFEVLPSGANFIFARHPAHTGQALASGLRTQAVLVRHFQKPRIDAFLRITIGTPEQNQRLLDALDCLLD